jgi:Cu2+-exporting ATPase
MSDCDLCGLPTPADPHTADDQPGAFCCRGCLEVARQLDEIEGTDGQSGSLASGSPVAAKARERLPPQT